VSNPDEPIENEFLIGGNEQRAIVLVDYDSSWPVRFQGERAKLTTALGTEAIRIEHIGSTAVPGLAAKPIIDVLVTVADIENEPRYLPALQRAGYVLRAHEPGHRMLRTPELGVHVHILPDGDPAVRHSVDYRAAFGLEFRVVLCAQALTTPLLNSASPVSVRDAPYWRQSAVVLSGGCVVGCTGLVAVRSVAASGGPRLGEIPGSCTAKEAGSPAVTNGTPGWGSFCKDPLPADNARHKPDHRRPRDRQ
jgi:GrpB-like predicted nucleotidyltransferase (UPF0157 family)